MARIGERHVPRRALQRWVASGYEPSDDPAVPVTEIRIGDFQGGIAVLCPTYIERYDEAQHLDLVHHLLDAIEEVRRQCPSLTLTLWIGMQWSDSREAAALDRTRLLCRTAESREIPNFACRGLVLRGPGKLRTINAALRCARETLIAGWAWIDDDVRLQPGCLSLLVLRFLQLDGQVAVGARKIAIAAAHSASRTFRAVSSQTQPPRAYPNACCMVVPAQVLANGIPSRRVTDDGFVVFELLDPAHTDPYHRMEVLEDACCRFVVGGDFRQSLSRLRRLLYSHVTCMADYSWPIARVYFRTMLFHGLWPLAEWGGARRWLVKALHFGLFSLVVTELAVRGLLLRPRRSVAWGGVAEVAST
jgi:hypothetical protein